MNANAAFLSEIAALRAEFAPAAAAGSAPAARPDPTFLAASRAAAVRGWFDPADLPGMAGRAGTDPPAWLDPLGRVCLTDQADPGRWFLLEPARRDALAAMARDGTLATTIAAAAGEPHAAVMGTMLRGAFDLARTAADELSVAGEVSRWLAAVPDAHPPSPDALARAIELKLRDDELDRLSRGMIGRQEELSELLRFVFDTWAKPDGALPIFRLEGIGGMGKSTLLAEFVRRRLPTLRYREPIVIWIDYDRLRIAADDVSSVLIEALRQFGWRMDDVAPALARARAELRTAAIDPGWSPPHSSFAMSEMSEEDAPAGNDTRMRAMVDLMAEALLGSGFSPDRPVLFVIDTMEQLDRTESRGYDLVMALSYLRQRAVHRLSVIAAGRSIFSAGVGADAIVLHDRKLLGLSRAQAVDLLVTREDMAEADAHLLIATFQDMDEDAFKARIGLPMLLTLLARLVRDGRIDVRDPDLDKVRGAATAELATAYVYSRVLEHVPADLKRLAHPGLVLREVSEELLQDVIWPVIAPGEPLDSAACAALFRRLKDETWLVDPVERADPPRVLHRPDLRRAMLLLMYAEEDPTTRQSLIALNRRARAWHRERSERTQDPQERLRHLAESVYHALSLAIFTGRPADIRIGDVRAVRPRLRDLVTDFPEENHSAVSALVTGDASPEEIVALPIHLRAPVLRERLRGFLSRRAFGDAMTFCAALPADELGRSASLAWLAIRGFIASGRWASAAATIAPLVTGSDPPGICFGRSRPSLLPYVAAFIVTGGKVTVARPAGVGAAVNYRYLAIEALLRCLATGTPDARTEAIDALGWTLGRTGTARPTGDVGRLEAILGALLANGRYGGKGQATAVMSWSVKGLGLDPKALSTMSAARLVQRCRASTTRVAVRTDRQLPRPGDFAPVLADFHTPLALALAAAADPQQAYRIADAMWGIWFVRTADMRPATFMDACRKPAIRRERFRTLVALADRSRAMDALLATIAEVVPDDPDLAAVMRVVRRWRDALDLHD